jgi:phage terminase small subunit
MARPKKPDDQLTRPRTLKTPDGKPVLRKGRPPKSGATVQLPVEQIKRLLDPSPQPLPPDADVEIGNLTPLEYALTVMNDPREPKERRDRLCVAAMPFVHVKMGEGGKREKAAGKAETASKGKFAPATAPKLSVVGK